MSCITSVDGIKSLVIDLIFHLSRDVIGSLSIKPRCYWCVLNCLLSELNSSLLLVNIVGYPAILS